MLHKKKDKQQLQQHESITSSSNSAAALLINPFTLHTEHNTTTSQTSVTASLNASPLQQQHQNVRDMDIVHVISLILSLFLIS
jgi:hypothetical protein